VFLRVALSIARLKRLIRVRPFQIDRHFQSKFGIGDVLNLSCNQFSLLSKFFLKLLDERLRSLHVCFFVRGACVVRDAVSNRRNGRENGHKKQQEKLRPEAHGLAPASDLVRASRGTTKGSL
jgi:hypothetical protein